MIRRWRLILLLLAAAAFLLQIVWKIPLPFAGPWPTDGAVAALFRPVGEAFGGVAEAVTGLFRRYFFLSGLEEENQGLRGELERLKIENAALRENVAALADYRKALSAYAVDADALLPARLISHDLFSSSKTALIDKGRDHGVAIDDIVLAGEGLVGRVVTVFSGASKVLLLIDSHFAVDAVSARTGLRMLVSGTSGALASAEREPFLTQVEYLEKTEELREGDSIETSGLSGIFPGGILVGSVDRVSYSEKNLFDKARVLPAVDFAKLRRVYVRVGGRGP